MRAVRPPLMIVAWLILVIACGGASRAQPARTTGTTPAAKPSLDRRVQAAAEHALDGVGRPTDIIAMRASTGAVLAYAGRGGHLPADDALIGKYPTGSTYKLVSSLALLEHGLTPDSAVRCPGSVTIDGRVVTNFGGGPQPAATLQQAFAQSCNTAFATLGAQLPNASFGAAAAQVGLGVPSHLGSRAFTGSLVVPASAADRAALASDGGGTVVSSLALATIAATIDSGSLHAATLTATASAAASPSHSIPERGLPQGTHAKTGTAEFEDAAPPRTVYAWLVGYRGDIAFAVLVIGGAEGGPVAGPIAARFVAALA
jgi:cell division protein FtsI/penicillin-binding protein 2